MSKQRKAKTEGLAWLELSFAAFNGSGYAPRTTPEAFVEEYILYNRWKKRPQAVELANMYYQPLLVLAQHFINNSTVEKQPSPRPYLKFEQFKKTLS